MLPQYRFLDPLAGPTTLVDLLRQRAECQADDRAYTFLVDGESEEVHLTYRELDRQARAIGAWLQSQDLKGQRALLLYPPGLDFIVTFFGCQYAEVVAVPAYPPRMNRAPSRIQAIAADAGATVALTTDAILGRVRPLIDQTSDLKELRWLSTDRTAHSAEGYERQWQRPQITGDTLAFLQYTSGSTGTPKGVMLSHSNLLHNSALIAHAFEHTRSACGVFWLPNCHDMGLVGGIVQPLYVGRPNILMSPAAFLQKPFRWLQAISRYRGTTSGGPNFAFDICVRKITPGQRAKLDLSSWTVAFTGAEPVRAETLERFAETFAPCGFRPEAFYPCYGLAEATLLVSGGYKTAPPIVRCFDGKSLEGDRIVPIAAGEGGARALVGCGQTMLDQQVVIADPTRLTRLPAGQVGEVWVSGPSVAQGYWQRTDETEQTFRAYLQDTVEGPFLRTGDLGFTHDGELFITGRLKDLIVVHGGNHYPQDIEATAAKSHPGVRAGWGAAFIVEEGPEQKLVIILELERHQRAEVAQVIGAIRRDVAREHNLVVDSIVLVHAGSIPKTSSGKVQRHACRDAFLDRSLEVLGEWHRAGSAGPVAARSAPRRRQAGLVAISEDQSPREAGEQRRRPKAARGPATSNRTGAAAGGQTLEATTEIVLDVVRSIGKDRAVGLELDSSIVELGLDSLERMEIVAALEDHFGGRFPEHVIAEMSTCREVIDAVQKHLVNGRDTRTPSRAVEISPENYRFDRYPEYIKLRQNLEMLESTELGNPFFKVHERVSNDRTVIGGREMINFSSYNYVGMSGDPVVTAAAKAAIDRYGTSVSASRLVSGEKGLHRDLERAIADFIGAEDAVVFVGGHSTNETTVGHLFGPADLILHDALAHNSIVQGCILSGAHRRPFPHNNWQVVDRLLADLRGDYRRVLVAIEGVYSTDGDIPDLPRFIEVKKRHKAFLMVDEAHSIGVLGPHGRGIGEYFSVNPQDVDLWMGTLSKSFGSCGGYIAGCRAMVEYLKYTAPGFVYSVGISPANAAAALAAIRLLKDEPERLVWLHERARLFLTLARSRGLNTGLSKDSPIVPVILGDSVHCLRLSRAMFDRGINVQPILYPAVEERAARLRFFITASHTEEQIRHSIDVTAEEVERINPKYLGQAGPVRG